MGSEAQETGGNKLSNLRQKQAETNNSVTGRRIGASVNLLTNGESSNSGRFPMHMVIRNAQHTQRTALQPNYRSSIGLEKRRKKVNRELEATHKPSFHKEKMHIIKELKKKIRKKDGCEK